MKTISRYIISFVVFLMPVICSAQDTIRYPINPMKGIRVGVDFSKFLLPLLFNYERSGFEASIDMYVRENMFAIVEAGWLNVSLARTDFLYKQYGTYGKIGIDYNLLKHKVPKSNDMVYAGVRYGYSKFNQQAERVIIPGYYWPPDLRGETIPLTYMNAHWLELLLGVKAEVLKNLYLGMSFRLKFRLIPPKDEFSTPYMIPGYGTGSEKSALSINYYLSYNIHF